MGRFGGGFMSLAPNHNIAHLITRIVNDLIIKYNITAPAFASVREMANSFGNRVGIKSKPFTTFNRWFS